MIPKQGRSPKAKETGLQNNIYTAKWVKTLGFAKKKKKNSNGLLEGLKITNHQKSKTRKPGVLLCLLVFYLVV